MRQMHSVAIGRVLIQMLCISEFVLVTGYAKAGPSDIKQSQSLVEAAERRVKSPIGEKYRETEKTFFSSNPKIATNPKATPKEILGKKEYEVNWGAVSKCSPFVWDVIYEAGFEPELLSITEPGKKLSYHYQVAGQFQTSDKLEMIYADEALPGSVIQLFGTTKANESHALLLAGKIVKEPFKREGWAGVSDKWKAIIDKLINDKNFIIEEWTIPVYGTRESDPATKHTRNYVLELDPSSHIEEVDAQQYAVKLIVKYDINIKIDSAKQGQNQGQNQGQKRRPPTLDAYEILWDSINITTEEPMKRKNNIAFYWPTRVRK